MERNGESMSNSDEKKKGGRQVLKWKLWMGFSLFWFVFLGIVSQGIGALMHYYNYGKMEIVFGYNKQ